VFRVGLDRNRFVRPDDHEKIVSGRPVMSMISKGFSKLSFHAVSTNRVADAATDGQSDPQPIEIVGTGVDQQRA